MDAMQNVDDAGLLEGKLLVFGGVYSNLHALTALKRVADELGLPSSNVICTGDVVAYCAHPVECIQLIRDWGVHCIAGNVEIQLGEGAPDCGCDFSAGSSCDLYSRNWYAFAARVVGEEERVWMRSLPRFLRFRYAGRSCFVLHGALRETAGYVFRSTPADIRNGIYEATGAGIVLAGHCGLPFISADAQGTWVNSGALGMPANDGDARVWYAIIEESADGRIAIQLKRLEYDHDSAALDMEAQRLPLQYAKTLRTGIWDNCDILPPEETALQGQPIAETTFTLSV